MGYIIAAYFAMFFILRKLVNSMHKVVEKNGKLYEVASAGSFKRCTYGKNTMCGLDKNTLCTKCYLNSEISHGKFILGRVILGLYSAVIVIGGIFFVSMMCI